jgi:endoglucanase
MKVCANATLFFSILLIATGLWAQGRYNRFLTDSEAGIAIKSGMVEQTSTEPDSIPPDSTDMRSITSVELAEEMVPGWNVGNSLDAISSETAWGNPMISQTLMDSIKAAGFNAVRIPVAWGQHSDTSTFIIEESWLARVEEVIGYVLRSGMYAIINEHWDEGWIQPTYADSESVSNRLGAMWKQIAIHFRDYDDHLLFAGTNEVMMTGNYGTPTREYYTVQNSYNQTFVNAVRSTGGRNYYRHLLVQGFNTNIGYTVSYFTIPKDVTPNRLIVEVHYYDPYDFTINTSSNIVQWGRWATDPSKTETWANESYTDGRFNIMKTNFIDKGYAVVLGEYGAMARLDLGSDELNADYAKYRRYYMFYITHSLVSHGLVPFYWDNGFTGDNGMGIFNRSTGAQVYPDIVKAIIDGADTTIASIEYKEESLVSSEFTLSQNYPNPFNPNTRIAYSLQENVRVFVGIYNINGQLVRILVDQQQPAGTFWIDWDGRDSSRNLVSNGIYFYQLRAGSYVETRKLVLTK